MLEFARCIFVAELRPRVPIIERVLLRTCTMPRHFGAEKRSANCPHLRKQTIETDLMEIVMTVLP